MDAEAKHLVRGFTGFLAWIGAEQISRWLAVGVAALTIIVLLPRAIVALKNTWLLLGFWSRRRRVQARPEVPPVPKEPPSPGE